MCIRDRFGRRKNHGRISGIFCLQDQQTVFFQHTFQGGCFVVDDDNGKDVYKRQGVMKRIDKDETRKGELIKFDVDFTEADMNVEVLEVVKSEDVYKRQVYHTPYRKSIFCAFSHCFLMQQSYTIP